MSRQILWRDEWEGRKAAAMDEAHRRMMREPVRLYLYIIPATADRWGEFLIASDGQEPDLAVAELATPEAIPCHLDRAGLGRWLEAFANHLPMVAGNDV